MFSVGAHTHTHARTRVRAHTDTHTTDTLCATLADLPACSSDADLKCY